MAGERCLTCVIGKVGGDPPRPSDLPTPKEASPRSPARAPTGSAGDTPGSPRKLVPKLENFGQLRTADGTKVAFSLDEERKSLFGVAGAANLEEGWKFVKKTKHNICVYMQPSPSETNLKQVCGKVRMNFPVSAVDAIVRNTDNWKLWDPILKSVEVEPLDKCHNLIRLTFHGIFPVKSREFVYVQTLKAFANGDSIQSGYSIPESPVFPPRSSAVRAFLFSSGWAMQAVPGDPGSCDVTYLLHVDPTFKSMPRILLDLVAVRFPEVMNKVRKMLEKDSRTVARSNLKLLQTAGSTGIEMSNDAAEEQQRLSVGQRPGGYSSLDQKVLDNIREAVKLHKWKLVNRAPNAIFVYSKPSPYGPKSRQICVKTVVPTDVESVATILASTANWKDLDPDLQECTKKQKDPEHSLLYARYKPGFLLPFKERDYCLHQLETGFPDGSCIIAGTSFEHADHPPRSSVTRGSVHTAGWHLRPIPKRENETALTYMFHVDFTGAGIIPPPTAKMITHRVARMVDHAKYLVADGGKKSNLFSLGASSVHTLAIGTKTTTATKQSKLSSRALNGPRTALSMTPKTPRPTAVSTADLASQLISADLDKRSVNEVSKAVSLGTEWQFVRKSKSGIQTYTSASSHGTTMKQVCGKIRVPYSPEEWLAVAGDYALWKTWDPVLKTVDIDRLDDTHTLIRIVFKGVFPVSGREAVYVETKNRGADGSVSLSGLSVLTTRHPKQGSLVRATIHGGGWHMMPVKGDAKSCDVTYSMNVDPDLKIVPNFLLNMAISRFPLVIDKVAKSCEANRAKAKK